MRISYGQLILRIAASGGYLILTAINSVYPIALTKIYHGAEARRPSMPQLHILSN